MNALTVSFIVALIGAIAFVAVAVITAHARIGSLPAITIQDSSKPSHVSIGLTESAKKFRGARRLKVVRVAAAVTRRDLLQT